MKITRFLWKHEMRWLWIAIGILSLFRTHIENFNNENMNLAHNKLGVQMNLITMQNNIHFDVGNNYCSDECLNTIPDLYENLSNFKFCFAKTSRFNGEYYKCQNYSMRYHQLQTLRFIFENVIMIRTKRF